MKQTLFEAGTLIPRIEHTKRVGRPRQKWLEEACTAAHHTFHPHEPFDTECRQHMLDLAQHAQLRQGVFSTKPKRDKISVFK